MKYITVHTYNHEKVMVNIDLICFWTADLENKGKGLICIEGMEHWLKVNETSEEISKLIYEAETTNIITD